MEKIVAHYRILEKIGEGGRGVVYTANERGEPRFQKLLERVKYEWEHFEV